MHLRLHDVNPFIIFKNYILFSNLVIMSCSKMSFCIILYVYFNLFTVNITQFNPRVAKLYSINYLSHLSSFFIFFGVPALSCFFLSVSRIGTCRIHAYLINSAFNLPDERDSAAREKRTWEKEIQKWKAKSEECELENQVLQENLKGAMEKQGELILLSSNLEIANEKQQEQIRQLQRMKQELQNKVTNEREQRRGE